MLEPPVMMQYKGTGTGSGANPIQTDEWKFGIVSDECPECLSGSIDLAVDGDGRWQVRNLSRAFDMSKLNSQVESAKEVILQQSWEVFAEGWLTPCRSIGFRCSAMSAPQISSTACKARTTTT